MNERIVETSNVGLIVKWLRGRSSEEVICCHCNPFHDLFTRSTPVAEIWTIIIERENTLLQPILWLVKPKKSAA